MATVRIYIQLVANNNFELTVWKSVSLCRRDTKQIKIWYLFLIGTHSPLKIIPRNKYMIQCDRMVKTSIKEQVAKRRATTNPRIPFIECQGIDSMFTSILGGGGKLEQNPCLIVYKPNLTLFFSISKVPPHHSKKVLVF